MPTHLEILLARLMEAKQAAQSKPKPSVTPVEKMFLTGKSPVSRMIGESMYRRRTGVSSGAPPPPAPKAAPAPPSPPVFVPPVFTGFDKPTPPPPKIMKGSVLVPPKPPGLPPGTILVKKEDIEALQKAAKKQQEVVIYPFPYVPRLPRRYGVSRATGKVGRQIGRGEQFEHMLASKRFAVRRLGGLF